MLKGGTKLSREAGKYSAKTVVEIVTHCRRRDQRFGLNTQRRPMWRRLRFHCCATAGRDMHDCVRVDQCRQFHQPGDKEGDRYGHILAHEKMIALTVNTHIRRVLRPAARKSTHMKPSHKSA